MCGQPLDGAAQSDAQTAAGSTRPSTAANEAQPGPQDPPPTAVPLPPSPSLAPAPESAAPGAVRCPRCTKVNGPGARFCFSCGLPLDEARPTEEATAAHITPATGFATPAGFGVRFVAHVIDQITLIFILLGIYLLWGVLDPEFFARLEAGETTGTVYLVSIAVEASYYILAVGLWGTTIGKRAVGLKVVNPQGVRPSMGQAAGRYFAGILSALILLIGYLMIAFRADKRALHDLIANTWVVHK